MLIIQYIDKNVVLLNELSSTAKRTYETMNQLLQMEESIGSTSNAGIATAPETHFGEYCGGMGLLGIGAWVGGDNSLEMRLKGLSTKLWCCVV